MAVAENITPMPTPVGIGERMAASEAWQQGHERLCTERHANIFNTLEELKVGHAAIEKKLDTVVKAIIGVGIAIAGWALVTLATIVFQRDGVLNAPVALPLIAAPSQPSHNLGPAVLHHR